MGRRICFLVKERHANFRSQGHLALKTGDHRYLVEPLVKVAEGNFRRENLEREKHV